MNDHGDDEGVPEDRATGKSATIKIAMPRGVPIERQAQIRDAVEKLGVAIITMSTSAIEIGQQLLAVKAETRHGEFTSWVEDHLPFGPNMARRFMNVARRFGENGPAGSVLSQSVLVALAAPSTPDEVVEEITARAEAGEKITTATVQEAKAKAVHTGAPPAARAANQAAAERRARWNALALERGVDDADVREMLVKHGFEAGMSDEQFEAHVMNQSGPRAIVAAEAAKRDAEEQRRAAAAKRRAAAEAEAQPQPETPPPRSPDPPPNEGFAMTTEDAIEAITHIAEVADSLDADMPAVARTMPAAYRERVADSLRALIDDLTTPQE